MANLLLYPDNWTNYDAGGPSPWNGSFYVWTDASPGRTIGLAWQSATNPSTDFVEGTVSFRSPQFEGEAYLICYSGIFGVMSSTRVYPEGDAVNFYQSLESGSFRLFLATSPYATWPSQFDTPFSFTLTPTGSPGPDPDPTPSGGSSGETESHHVYELDKGWSFDGAYIPHFLEMNWYFGDDPFTDKTIQKVRIHGLSKGLTQLQLSVAGMQHDYDSDFTEPQFINIPRNAVHISEEYIPVTNYVDSSNWGVSHQLRFEGSNTDLSKPEPSHVLQVLALQGSPQDNGKRIN